MLTSDSPRLSIGRCSCVLLPSSVFCFFLPHLWYAPCCLVRGSSYKVMDNSRDKALIKLHPAPNHRAATCSGCNTPVGNRLWVETRVCIEKSTVSVMADGRCELSCVNSSTDQSSDQLHTRIYGIFSPPAYRGETVTGGASLTRRTAAHEETAPISPISLKKCAIKKTD